MINRAGFMRWCLSAGLLGVYLAAILPTCRADVTAANSAVSVSANGDACSISLSCDGNDFYICVEDPGVTDVTITEVAPYVLVVPGPSPQTVTMSLASKTTQDYEAQCVEAVVKGKIYVLKVDLDIYNSQSGGLVPETDQDADGIEDEEDIGAFAVANLNDTNGDGHPDNDDSYRPVTANGNLGRNERDLMKLALRKPQPDCGGKVKLTVVSGDVKIWSDAIKTTEKSGADFEFPISNFTGDTIEWYVEARAATTLQGIKLKYEYMPVGASDWMCPDTVTATGIWAEKTKTLTANKTPAEVDNIIGPDFVANGNPVRNAVNGTQGTGVKPPGDPTHNVIVIEFLVNPANIVSVPVNYGDGTRARPFFDITRQIYGASFEWATVENPPTQLFPGLPHPHYPEAEGKDNEWPNDDARNTDEEDEPTADGHMWVIDTPGGHSGAMTTHRNNFKEWVRMGIGTEPAPNAVSGSRCSAQELWYTKSTLGMAATPNDLGTGNFAFEREALHTEPSSDTTVPGTRHHGVMRGLEVADTAGGAAETTHLILIDDDGLSDDTLDDVTGVSEVGKLVAGAGAPVDTLVGDQTAYTGVGYFASRFDGEIAGPDGTSGETTAELAHEIDVGGSNPQSPSTSVVGTPFSLPAPASPITMTLGTITTVSITGARAEAEDSAAGNQTVTILLIDDDGVSDDTLHTFTESVPKLMKDDSAGSPNVTAIKYGLLNAFNSTKGRIASKADGMVIGPDGSSGEQNAEIAYEIDMAGSNPQSSSVNATGPVYSKPAPTIGTVPIPIDGSSSVTMNQVYIEATGSTGNETFEVRVVDEDAASDDVLHKINASIARPADCFAGALIGPATPAVTGTLTNPSPGGEVKGLDGASGEQTAEIGYEIGGSSDNSATTSVTATAP